MNLLIIGAALALVAAEPLTLEEAIQIAEKNAFSLKIAATRIEKTRQQINEARGNLLPRLSAEGKYTKLDQGVTQSFGQGPAVVIQPDVQKTASFTLSFPVDITGTLGKGVKAARAYLGASKETYQAQRNDVRLNVRQAYYLVLQAQELVDVAKGNLASAQQSLTNAQKQLEQGAVARIEVLRFETLVASAESSVISAQNNLTLAEQAFNNALSRPIETEVVLAPAPPLPPVEFDIASLVGQALENRHELKALQNQSEALSFIRQAEERGMLPSLAVAGVQNYNFDPGYNGRDESAAAVATLSIPIWDNGVTRSRVKGARQDEEQARLQIEQLKLGLSLEVSQALSNLRNARARLVVATNQAAFAAENYRLARLRYEAGEAIQLEVLDAQAQDTQAKAERANAQYAVLSAYAALQRAVGNDQPATQ